MTSKGKTCLERKTQNLSVLRSNFAQSIYPLSKASGIAVALFHKQNPFGCRLSFFAKHNLVEN